ncbi:13934_t:CDS:2 [Acaulospora morrowiae]|uniref:13934_t:CDS:1 n=1 Tax=Acaulospora morrowiae TaxID=94023 RepID=A0A9N9H2K6_9GLOM|nr:13934_t:CDS:2 [Acaulospora morrowiae]
MPTANDLTPMQDHGKIDDVETKSHRDKKYGVEQAHEAPYLMKDDIVHKRLDIEAINGMACQFQINNPNKDIGASKQTNHPGCGNPNTLHDKG